MFVEAGAMPGCGSSCYGHPDDSTRPAPPLRTLESVCACCCLAVTCPAEEQILPDKCKCKGGGHCTESSVLKASNSNSMLRQSLMQRQPRGSMAYGGKAANTWHPACACEGLCDREVLPSPAAMLADSSVYASRLRATSAPSRTKYCRSMIHGRDQPQPDQPDQPPGSSLTGSGPALACSSGSGAGFGSGSDFAGMPSAAAGAAVLAAGGVAAGCALLTGCCAGWLAAGSPADAGGTALELPAKAAAMA